MRKAVSDFSGLAGVDVEEQSENPLWRHPSGCRGWLLLFLGMGTSTLISQYEGLISDASILSVFVTLITGTSGNAGTQSLAVAVRKIGMQDGWRKICSVPFYPSWRPGWFPDWLLVSRLRCHRCLKQNFILGGIIAFTLVTPSRLRIWRQRFRWLWIVLVWSCTVASGPFISTFSDLTSVWSISISQNILSTRLCRCKNRQWTSKRFVHCLFLTGLVLMP